jgi:hypothetical protein
MVLYSVFLSVCSGNSILVVALAGPAVFYSAVSCPHSSLALCRVDHVGGHVWPASLQVHVLAATQVVVSHGRWSESDSVGCLDEKLTLHVRNFCMPVCCCCCTYQLWGQLRVAGWYVLLACAAAATCDYGCWCVRPLTVALCNCTHCCLLRCARTA